MVNYTPNEEEQKHYEWCMNNNIRISPGGLSKDKSHWTIDIKQGEVWKRSPKKYTSKEIWPEFYLICKWYYDRKNR